MEVDVENKIADNKIIKFKFKYEIIGNFKKNWSKIKYKVLIIKIETLNIKIESKLNIKRFFLVSDVNKNNWNLLFFILNTNKIWKNNKYINI